MDSTVNLRRAVWEQQGKFTAQRIDVVTFVPAGGGMVTMYHNIFRESGDNELHPGYLMEPVEATKLEETLKSVGFCPHTYSNTRSA